MENNVIMNNEEIMDEVVETAGAKSISKGGIIALSIGLTALTGIILYKVGKKVVAKIKAAKAEKAEAIEADYEDTSDDEN